MPLWASCADSAAVTLAVFTVSVPPSGIASRALTARLTITCSNWETSTLTGQRSRPCTRSSLTFSPINRRSSMVRSLSASPRSSTCGRRVWRRENASSCRTSGAGRVLLDLHDVLERRIGRLVRVQQEVVGHHDGREHVVEVVRDAAGELADHLHLLRLVDLVLQRTALGGLQEINDRSLGLAL